MKFQVVLEALADPTRRQILDLLKEKQLKVGDIAAHFEISGASMSYHLNKLKAADLVIKKRDGQHIYYSIHTSVFEDAATAVAELFELGGNVHE